MNIKNYRKVKAEQQDPGITMRWLISELEDAPNVAMKLMELAPATIGPVASCISYISDMLAFPSGRLRSRLKSRSWACGEREMGRFRASSKTETRR